MGSGRRKISACTLKQVSFQVLEQQRWCQRGWWWERGQQQNHQASDSELLSGEQGLLRVRPEGADLRGYDGRSIRLHQVFRNAVSIIHLEHLGLKVFKTFEYYISKDDGRTFLKRASALSRLFHCTWTQLFLIPSSLSSLSITTLQSKMNAKLSLHGFWHCHENGLIKTIQTIPHNLYVSFKSASLC